MQKVYVSEEEKEKIMDKLSRDIEVMIDMYLESIFSITPLCHCYISVPFCAVPCADEDYGLQPAARYP